MMRFEMSIWETGRQGWWAGQVAGGGHVKR